MKVKYVLSPDIRVRDFNDLIKKKHSSLIEETDPDVILVMGGDGAMLHAIQSHIHYDKPFLGIASGTLNFLMNEIQDKESFLDELLNDSLSFSTYEMRSIKVSIVSENKGICFRKLAVNEVVVGDNIMNYHHFSLSSEREEFEDFVVKGSGVCVSTTLGSTAFNFNNGGSVLPLEVDLWNLTDIVCNYNLNDILIPQRLEITLLSDRAMSNVYVDGIDSNVRLSDTDKVILSPGIRIRIAFLDKSRFIQKRNSLANRSRKQ